MERVNLLAPEFRSDPYPFYAEMRRSAPVCQVEPGGMWAVARHDDIVRVFKDTELFSSAGIRVLAAHPGIDHSPLAESLVMMDPPAHTKARALVSHAFSASAIPRIEPLVRAAAIEAVATIRAGGVIDFCEVLATRVPATAIAELLGLDVKLRDQMQHWSEHLESVNPGISPEHVAEVKATITAMEGYLVEVIESRRQAPKDDLVSDLLAAQIDGTALTRDEIVSFLCLLLVAGLETTSHLLTTTVRFLIHHPDVQERVRRDPALIPALIEEMLRYDPPGQATMRLSTADAEIGGVRVPAGSIVILLLGSAGRDESKYEAPEGFDLDRPKQVNMAFGYGIHFCIGAMLARTEARIALEELLKLPGRLEEAGEHTWNMSISVRGMVRYPIRYVG
jgi:cytochrome P450